MSAATGRPRPFLTGVFRTACNYCVRSKRGCSGGSPCDQCQKRGKSCVYAQRRMSGPRGRPSGRSYRVRSRTKARRETRIMTTVAAGAVGDDRSWSSEPPAALMQGWVDDCSMLLPKRDSASEAVVNGGDGQLPLQLPHRSIQSMTYMSFGSRSESPETTNESLTSSYSSEDSDYPSDGDGNYTTGSDDGGASWSIINHRGDSVANSAVQKSSGDGITKIPMKELSAGKRPSHEFSGGRTGLDGVLGGFSTLDTGETSAEQQKDRYSRPAPLLKACSSLSSILDNSLENDDSDEEGETETCWGESLPSISVETFQGPPQMSLANSPPSSCHNLTNSVPNDSCTSGSESLSLISEESWKVTQVATPVEGKASIIPATTGLSPNGARPLKSPVPIDDHSLRFGQQSQLTEQRSPHVPRWQSTGLYGDDEEVLLFGCVTPGQQQQQQPRKKQRQELQHSQQEHMQQRLQYFPPGKVEWKDVAAWNVAAVATADATTVNADLIHGSRMVTINEDQVLHHSPSRQSSITAVIPPATVSSPAGVPDFSPASPPFRSVDSDFTDASEDPRAIVSHHPLRQDSYAAPTMPYEDDGSIGCIGPAELGLSLDLSISARNEIATSLSSDSAILMDIDRSMNVATGSELYNEFIDLDCATMANMRTPLTREASLMRAMEGVGVNGSYDPSAFANLW